VKDLLSPLGRHVEGGRRAFVSEHRFDLAAKKLLVELESVLALTIEKKIRIEFHAALLEKRLNRCLSSANY
jgi:hypothetical protein